MKTKLTDAELNKTALAERERIKELLWPEGLNYEPDIAVAVEALLATRLKAEVKAELGEPRPTRMKYTAYEHRPGVVKVETKDRVICDTISDLKTAEMIASALNETSTAQHWCDMHTIAVKERATLRAELDKAQAKLSERKTVHEWLNKLGVPAEEFGKPICLLRRLRIALDGFLTTDAGELEIARQFLKVRAGMATQ